MEGAAPPPSRPLWQIIAAALGIAGGMIFTFNGILGLVLLGLVQSRPPSAPAFSLLYGVGIVIGLVALLGGLLLVLRPSWDILAGLLLMGAGLVAFPGRSYGGPYWAGEIASIAAGGLALVRSPRLARAVPARFPRIAPGHVVVGLAFLAGAAYTFFEAWSSYWSISSCYRYSGQCMSPFILGVYGLAFVFLGLGYATWGLWRETGLVVLGACVAVRPSVFLLLVGVVTSRACERTLPAPFSMFCSDLLRGVFLAVGVAILGVGSLLWLRRRFLTAARRGRRSP